MTTVTATNPAPTPQEEESDALNAVQSLSASFTAVFGAPLEEINAKLDELQYVCVCVRACVLYVHACVRLCSRVLCNLRVRTCDFVLIECDSFKKFAPWLSLFFLTCLGEVKMR